MRTIWRSLNVSDGRREEVIVLCGVRVNNCTVCVFFRVNAHEPLGRHARRKEGKKGMRREAGR